MSRRIEQPTTIAMLGVATSLLVAACGDAKSTGAATTAQPSASAAGTPPSTASAPMTATPSASAPLPSPVEEVEAGVTAAEPQRKTMRSAADDPSLYANRDFLADHYGVVRLPLPLEMQSVALPHARRALLFTGQGAALEKPMIVVVEQSHAIVWSKERPLAGTRERAKELTLSRGPRGEVLLFWYDEPTKIFAGREWTHDGGIFADYNVLSSEGCDGATVLYWPGHGWVAALVDGALLRAQLLGENGSRKWPDNGVELKAAPGAPAAGRPKIAVLDGKVIEISAGARKVKISPEGAVVK